ncbi:MAG: B12-binding domain-containing radical SAM protein [Desulfobacterales bacterium]|nr:B12-binding domain-containing radical SAM protein [Desulfobacterales bacterium]
MKVLLIQPPVRDFYQTSIRTQPIGLAYLAASLKNRGHEVEILDCQTETKKSIPIPAELSYLKDFYPFNDRSPFKLYSGYYHFGIDWADIRKRVENSKADVFGISSSFTPYHGEALEIAQIIKEWDRRKIVVMGGAHVSCDPEGVLQSPSVDYAVLGEGEVRFPLLLEQIAKGRAKNIEKIDGIGYRKVGTTRNRDGEIRINPLRNFIQDLDSLPPPARELLDLDRYRLRKKRSTMIITSRGCPHGCAYCSGYLVMGTSFRTRTPEAILKEMMQCQKQYGIQIFDIEDDNFTFDQERAKRLMNLIIEAFGEGKIELSAMNGISFASLDGELLKLMKRAGFHTINLSYVSTDPSTKERMGRPKTATEFDNILEKAEQVGLHVIAYAILGMPGQTIEEMVDTLIYLMGKKVLIGPSVYYPTPGTPLFERCKKDGILPSHLSQWRSSAFPIETKQFNRLDLLTLFRLARVINFIKGKMDGKELEEGMTWRELSNVLKEKLKTKFGDKENGTTWFDLLLLLDNERSFFGLRKGSGGKMSVEMEKSSKKVLDYFFEKAWQKPILKSHVE